MDIVTWFDQLKHTSYNYHAYEIASQAYLLATSLHPTLDPVIKYGGVFFGSGGIYVYENHCSFEFSQGTTFSDPDHFLEGSGKHRRHLKLRSIADIESKKLELYIGQMG